MNTVYIVTEFMPGGTFVNFLRKEGCNQTKKKLCRMCIDVCQVSKTYQIARTLYMTVHGIVYILIFQTKDVTLLGMYTALLQPHTFTHRAWPTWNRCTASTETWLPRTAWWGTEI